MTPWWVVEDRPKEDHDSICTYGYIWYTKHLQHMVYLMSFDHVGMFNQAFWKIGPQLTRVPRLVCSIFLLKLRRPYCPIIHCEFNLVPSSNSTAHVPCLTKDANRGETWTHVAKGYIQVIIGASSRFVWFIFWSGQPLCRPLDLELWLMPIHHQCIKFVLFSHSANMLTHVYRSLLIITPFVSQCLAENNANLGDW